VLAFLSVIPVRESAGAFPSAGCHSNAQMLAWKEDVILSAAKQSEESLYLSFVPRRKLVIFLLPSCGW
jgi:hypothetical protein